VNASRALALAAVTGILVVVADIPTTSRVAQTFAVVLMGAVLFAYGPQAIANLEALVTGAHTGSTAGTNGPSSGSPIVVHPVGSTTGGTM
jgi:hypothetical protein